MTEQTGIFGRIGRWLRRRFTSQDDLPLLYGQTQTTTQLARRSIFPWGRQEEDLSSLQAGLTSMTALMSNLRQYLDEQSSRHNELLTYLSQLSHALQSIPDTGRVQSETLRVLHQQIAFQNAQHKQLTEIIRKIADSTTDQHEIAEVLRDRVETLYKNDQEIASTISGMGDSISTVANRSQTNSILLERLRDNLVTRDGDLERAIRRENRLIRGTLMLVAAVSIAALVIAVGISLYSYSAITQTMNAATSSREAVASQTPAVPPVLPTSANPASRPAASPATLPAATQSVSPAARVPVTKPTTQPTTQPR